MQTCAWLEDLRLIWINRNSLLDTKRLNISTLCLHMQNIPDRDSETKAIYTAQQF